VEDLPWLVTMLFKGVAEEDGEFVTSLMLVLVVLLGFDRRSARRVARGVSAERALVRVAAKLAGASLLDESEGQVLSSSRSSRTLWYASRRQRLVEALRVAMRTDFRTSSMERLPM